MKIVFLLRHALYLRNFEGAVRDLADRGHELLFVFSPLVRRVDTTLLTQLKQDYPNITEHPIAPRVGWWWPASDGLRVMRDYLRYLEPEFAEAPALVERGGARLPAPARWIFKHVPGMKSAPVRRVLNGALRVIERAVPPDAGIVAELKTLAPNLLLVTPMIDFTYGQTEYVKAARSLGIPTILAVASWDNLTNKGLIHVCPDRVLVWNTIQEGEAVQLHGVPRERVLKTGAQLYDHWFTMSPSLDRAAFCSRVGNLDPGKTIILYLCSSSFICRDEVTFVKEWLSELRASADPKIRDANVIVRPHPAHGEQWRGASLSSLGHVVVWPPEGEAPINESRKRDYFDSLYHAGVVVGINTSGFIEAGIVGRRTLTVATHFRTTQEGTLHFHYLTEGGLLETAATFSEHLAQLSRALANPSETQREVRAFIADFVRPCGLDKPATPVFVEAVESGRALTKHPWQAPFYALLLRSFLLPAVAPLRKAVLEAINFGMYRGIERTKMPRLLEPIGRSPHHSHKMAQGLCAEAYRSLERMARSNRPIIVGPWLAEVGYEILYWIPMLRWAQEAYGLDPKRLVVISRGGVESWYHDIAERYLDLFDFFEPAEFMSFNAERQQASGMQKQKRMSEAENRLLREVQKKLKLGDYDLLHPRLMFSGILHLQWSGRTSFDHLRHHTRYEPLPLPQRGEIEMRLPDDYYAVRFYARESFTDSSSNRQFVRNLIEKLLGRSDVVLLDTGFCIDDHDEIAWMEAATNGYGYNNRLIKAADWMTPRNNLEVQSRIIARSRCFAGTYGGLSYVAPFYGKPSIALHQQRGDVMDSHVSTALAVFNAFNVPFMLLTPDEGDLLKAML